jgi:S1-C subfamily serine protease
MVRAHLALGLAEQSGFVEDAEKRGAKKPRGLVVLRCLSDCQGIELGDWLLAYNNISLGNAKQLGALVNGTPIERAVKLTVVRNGVKQTLSVRVEKLSIEVF